MFGPQASAASTAATSRKSPQTRFISTMGRRVATGPTINPARGRSSSLVALPVGQRLFANHRNLLSSLAASRMDLCMRMYSSFKSDKLINGYEFYLSPAQQADHDSSLRLGIKCWLSRTVANVVSRSVTKSFYNDSSESEFMLSSFPCWPALATI